MSYTSYVTNGLGDSLPNYAPLVAGGATVFINPAIPLNVDELPPVSRTLGPNLNLSPTQSSNLQSIFTIKNSDGEIIVPTSSGFTSLGSGYSINFDPNSLQGRLVPSLSTSADPRNDFGAMNVYTGADVRLMIESAVVSNDGRRYAKQLLEATTITVSVHREVVPVRASGYINPKGFALGTRTIAGTLILTQFNTDTLFSFLQSSMLIDGSKDSVFTKVDQLPPFNITMIFTNEAGFASQRKLLGVKFVTDGVTYSIQDMLIEQTLSWMATDFTPLIPLNLTNFFEPASQMDRTTRRESTPTDLMKQPSSSSPTEDSIWRDAGLS
jgi:hypothetical protein